MSARHADKVAVSIWMTEELLKEITAFARRYRIYRVDRKRQMIDRTATIKLLCRVWLDGLDAEKKRAKKKGKK